MKVGIIVDNPIRDLPGCILVARDLARQGVEPVLVPLYQQGTDVPLMGLDAVLLNYARLNNLPLMRTYRDLGIALFVLDTEGGVLSEAGADSPENWARSARQNRIHEIVDGYFFWGSRVQEAFVRESGIVADRLRVTGPPRYDMCSPKWRQMLQARRQGYVLVNTNFSAINPLYTVTAEAEKNAFQAAGWKREYIDQFLADLREVFERYLCELERLIRDCPEQTFVVRPHPFEARDLYRRRFVGYPNVVVDPSGSIFNVIHNASCVLHLNCGTAVESVLLGKLPVSLEYLNTDIQRRHTPLPSHISFGVESYADLKRVIGDIGRTAATFDFDAIKREYIRPWFHDVDGHASQRVAEELLSILRHNGGGPRRTGWVASLRSSSPDPSLKQRLQGVVNNALGSKHGAAVRNLANPEWRHKAFGAKDVRELLAMFDRVDGAAVPSLAVTHAHHPLTRLPLASIRCIPGSGMAP